MAGNKSDRQTRVIFRRSPTVLKIILLAALLASTVTLLVLRFALLDEKDKAEAHKRPARHRARRAGTGK